MRDHPLSPLPARSSLTERLCRRWRSEYQNDFAARIQWSIAGAKANHPPSPVIGGNESYDVVHLTANAGETTVIDASASFDRDGDSLSYEWSFMREIDTYQVRSLA